MQHTFFKPQALVMGAIRIASGRYVVTHAMQYCLAPALLALVRAVGLSACCAGSSHAGTGQNLPTGSLSLLTPAGADAHWLQAIKNDHAASLNRSVQPSTGPERFAIAATLTDTSTERLSLGGDYPFEVRNAANAGQATPAQNGFIDPQTGAPDLLRERNLGTRSIIQGTATFSVNRLGVGVGLWGNRSSQTAAI